MLQMVREGGEDLFCNYVENCCFHVGFSVSLVLSLNRSALV